jgi:mannose-1-phosphate guanylyltransferase
MKALILVGGEGTRLRPLTCHTPKAMVPVLNVPFLEHYLDHLHRHGVTEIVLAMGHLSRPLDEYFGDGSRFGIRLVRSLEDQPLGTAGAIKNAERCLEGTFIAGNGDQFTDLDLTAMCRFHRERKAVATIALTPVEDPTSYGLIETDRDGRVLRFVEKPKKEDVTTNMINAGTYVLGSEVLDIIHPGANVSIERQVFPQLVRMGAPVYAFPSTSYWIDIGTPAKYLQVQRDLLEGKVSGYERTRNGQVIAGKKCIIHPGAQIKGPAIIGDNCIIEKDAKLTGPIVLGQGVDVHSGATISGSILWNNVEVESGVVLKDSIVANDSCLKAECNIEGAVIGDHVTVDGGARLGPGAKIWPSDVKH